MSAEDRSPSGELAEPLGLHQEEWRPIPGFPGYEASDRGRIRSWRQRSRGRVLKLMHSRDGYPRVSPMCGDRRKVMAVHRLVMLAFVGPLPEGLQTRHLDGDKTNSAVSNLQYGTASENVRDRRIHGVDPYASRDACSAGHSYTTENTYWDPCQPGTRRCRVCRAINQRRYLERRKSAA